MKRMSDVFDLPVSYVDAAELTVNLSVSEVEYVQRAINNVDALADALENLVSDYERHVELYGTDLTDDDCARIDKKMKDSRVILNTYRGEA